MSWDYRVMKKTVDQAGKSQDLFGIHEVFYDEQGKTSGWTEDWCYPLGETLEELQDDMARFMRAFQKPVLDYDAEPEAPFSEAEPSGHQ